MCRPSDTTRWVPAQQSVSKAKFDGQGSSVPLEPSSSPVPATGPLSALSLLGDIRGEAAPLWRHWIVRMEPSGRITLPSDRQVLKGEGSVQAISRGLMLVLRCGGIGASFRIDHRGRIVLPAWLRQATQSTGCVLVAARSAPSPTVVVVATGVLESLLDRLVSVVE